MKIIIHSVNIELTPAIKSFAEKKIGSLAKFLRANSDSIEAKVEIGKPSRHHKSGFVYYAEVNLKIGKKLIRASSRHNDLYTAINDVRDETEVQVKKFKEKIGKTARRQTTEK